MQATLKNRQIIEQFKDIVDVLHDEPDDCAVLASFLHRTIKFPKYSRKRVSNIVAATDLDRQRTKKTVKNIRTYFTTKTKKNSMVPEQLPKYVKMITYSKKETFACAV